LSAPFWALLLTMVSYTQGVLVVSGGLAFVSYRVMNNNKSRVDGSLMGSSTTVSFGERFQSSEQFDHIFREGMALVERTAAYLDGSGRKEAKGLVGGVAVLYATESMRLTTRLLDLASWLLIRRALKEGEISEEEALKKRRRVKLQAFGRPAHVKGFEELPDGLKKLVDESFSLHDRIVQLDRAMSVARDPDLIEERSANPVAQQMSLLQRALQTKAN
jgi:regulator of CtrA degradation